MDELNAKLNSMIRDVMGKRTASKIAEECGVSVSTITRIRNGENKRGISADMLNKLWKNRAKSCSIDWDELNSINTEVSDAYMKKEEDRWDKDQQEIEFLEKQIQNNIVDSGILMRKITDRFTIIPDVELYPEMAYEVALDNGERKRLFFFTQFYSNRRIEQKEKAKQEDPKLLYLSVRHYRTILEFQELRALHPEYENTELVIVYNYEDDFRYNAKTLKKLSKKGHVTLALMRFDSEKLKKSGKLLEEICLDGRKKGVLTELGLIR